MAKTKNGSFCQNCLHLFKDAVHPTCPKCKGRTYTDTVNGKPVHVRLDCVPVNVSG